MTGPHDAFDGGDGERLFLAQLKTIEQAIAFACRRAGFRYADAEDFASYVKLRLIENDYLVLRKYEGRCPFAGYISIVVQRMLLDYRIHLWGKWHASAEAKRLGPVAVALESLMYRDGLTLDEAFSTLRREPFEVSRAEVERIAALLPSRSPRPRAVDLDAISEEELCAHHVPATGPAETDRTALCRRVGSLVRQAIEQLPDSERLLFRLRFEAGMSIAEIARALQLEQKPLYRRVDALMAVFRAHLEAAGVRSEDVLLLIGDPASDLDFGFAAENSTLRPSSTVEGREESEEAP